MALTLDDYDYDLPKSFIAQEPAEPRDACKLLVQDLRDGTLTHRVFRDIAGYLDDGDVLVLNDSRVMPVKFAGRKATGGRLGILAVTRHDEVDDPREFAALVSGKLRPGDSFSLLDDAGVPRAAAVLVEKNGGRCRIRLTDTDYSTVLRTIGTAPLPPYIKKQVSDPALYQTTFSKDEGSIAAPTAGMHFTPALLDTIRRKGVRIATVTLHIGPGTFMHVDETMLARRSTEPEYFSITQENADIINRALDGDGRVIPVGTTSVKTLESAADETGRIARSVGTSSLFIAPGYTFKVPMGAFLTNFHLPKSTLLLLTAAYEGRENLMRAYTAAREHNYRFYSFGDAMFIITR